MCSGYREIAAPWPVPNHTSKKDLVHFYDFVTLDVCLQQFFTQPDQDLAVSCGKSDQIRHSSCLPCQTPQCKCISDTVSMLSLLLSCVGRNPFVFRCLEGLSSPFFSTFFTIFTSNIEHGTSRGKVTRLLQVPFFRDPSRRKSIQFVGAILWNMLPPLARRLRNLLLFRQFISTFDLTAVEII